MVTALLLLVLAAPALAQDDPGWPREIDTPKATIVIYEPQVDSLRGTLLAGRAAISTAKPSGGEPVFGALWFTATVSTDRDAETSDIHDFKVVRVRFPGITPEQEAKVIALVQEPLASWTFTMSLQRLTANLQAAQQIQATAANLKNTPPRIVFAKEPTVLVLIDGQPILRGVEQTEFQRVVNTPFAIVFDPRSKDYFLNGGRYWYTARAATGPWQSILQPPKAVAELVAPDTSAQPAESGFAAPPRIMVATEPTELIVTTGEPAYVPLTGTDLLYVSNTESDLFKEIQSQNYYLLLSGRWYRCPSLQGPWTFVPPDQLPMTFRQIPPDSPKADVLASVPGTTQAEDALADAQIPQTAAIKRSDVKLNVVYDGDPQFRAIEGTSVEYAVNTFTQVLKIGGKYYACDAAVWYVSDGPRGPWAVSDSVPRAVQEIPPSSPIYNVSYVTVFGSTPEVVYVGYYPGYVGVYPYYGTVVWGTGWYYPPYIGPVYYYPYPATWGFHAHYNPWIGWTFGIRYSTPFIAVGFHWNSHYYHGRGYYGGWYGPGYRPLPPGYRPPPPGYRPPGYAPRPTPYAQGGARPSTVPATGGRNNIYARPETRDRNASTEQSRAAQKANVARGRSNDVFTDQSGNIHRQTDKGWEQRQGNSWKPEEKGAGREPPAAPQTKPETRPAPKAQPNTNRDRLQRDAQARQRGAARSAPSAGGGRRR